MQRDNRTVTRIETSQRGVDQLAVSERTGRVGWRRNIDRSELDLDGSPATAPQQVEADVDDQAMQPGLEPVGIAKSRQVPPAADQRLLDRIARELRVPEDQPGGSVQPRECRIDEQSEGVMIAPPRAIDELSLVHGRLDVARPRRSRSIAYDVPRPQIVHRPQARSRLGP
jgi:hypothetical protein